MAARRVDAMDDATSGLIAASYAVPDVVVAVEEAVYNAIDANATHVNVVVDAVHASFSVTDDGDGIDPDEMFEHLFECQASSKMGNSTKKYGRRGQYLVALGTLAKQVELESRVEGHWTSFRKVVQNSQIMFNARSKTTKTTKGTVLRAENLFWLLPVRQRELENHGSARTRLIKRLSSFFHSISMIWPTLSVDVSYTDAKIPHSIITRAQSCEERLRSVFGDILGGDLEYVTLDDNELPFTIRGYAAVVRDAGDGDVYLESPGWRQARAYYQFVYLDNFWLEEFQRECCKAINNAAIASELGIPIFVLKINARGHEYDLHSDGNTRVVHVKRPELLMQTMRKFVRMLLVRAMEAEASVEVTAVNLDEEKTPAKCIETDDAHANDLRDHATHISQQCDDEVAKMSEDLALLQEINECGRDDVTSFSDAAWATSDGGGSKQNVYNEQWGYDDGASDCDSSDVDCDYYPFSQPTPLDFIDGRATPSTITYEEPSSTLAYDDIMYADEYSTVVPYDGYYGCMNCGSCGSYGPDLRLINDYQHYGMHQHLQHEVADDDYIIDSHYSLEHGCGTRGNRYAFSEATLGDVNGDYGGQHDGDYETKSSFHCDDDSFEELATPESSEATHQGPCPRTTAQQQEFDRLFFGKSHPRQVPPPRKVRRRQAMREGSSEADQWVSSRRIGVPTPSEDPESENPDQYEGVETGIIQPDLFCGSRKISEYFSLEKLAKAHSQSLGNAISRFASKRTALSGMVTSCGIEKRPTGVQVRKLPSDLNAPNAKTMTLDKTMLRQLQVIKQVDRKFILVKATLKSAKCDDHDGLDEDTNTTLLLCIDQHAADERVRLEQFESQVFGPDGNERNVGTVSHAPPLLLSLNARERETLRLFSEDIHAWGFRVENAECDVVSLTQTPKIDSRVAGADDFREYLQLLARSDAMMVRGVLRPPVITRFLHSRACRSAIMFGDYLSYSQCVDIIEQLRDCQLPFQCAHGRPSIVPLAELA